MERRQLGGGGAAVRGGARLVLAAAVAVLAGCGGSRSYVDRADAICRDRAQAVAALRAPRSPVEQEAAYERLVALEQREAARLAKLAPPSGRKAEAGALVAALTAVAEAGERLRVAGLSGDSESAQGAVFRGRKAAAAFARHAQALGLKVCGR